MLLPETKLPEKCKDEKSIKHEIDGSCDFREVYISVPSPNKVTKY